MMLPGIPTVMFGFILSNDTFIRFRGVRGFPSRLWALIMEGELNHGTESRAQRTCAAKQQLRTSEQALASSGYQVFLGHLYAIVSRYSPAIIARNEVRTLASVRERLSGLDRRPVLGWRTSAGSVKVSAESKKISQDSLDRRERCKPRH